MDTCHSFGVCHGGKAWDEASGVRTSLTLSYDACCHCIPVIFVWLLFIWCHYPLPHSTVIASSSLTCCSTIYCCPQLIVASFYHFTSILLGCCHHSLCDGSCCCHHCPKMLFPFCWAWQWNSCFQNCCTGMLYQKLLHHNAVAKVTTTLLPKVRHCHAIAKGVALPCCCQGCSIAMLLPKLLHLHIVAKAASPPCCCWSHCIAMLLLPLSTGICHDAVANMVHHYVVAAAYGHCLLWCFCHRPGFASCTAVFAVAMG